MEMYYFLLALFFKHQIFDFEYQPEFQWKNKGTYLHLGGLVHALQHVIGTWIVFFVFHHWVLFPFDFKLVSFILIAEFLIHYHMDWFKMNYLKKHHITVEQPVFWR